MGECLFYSFLSTNLSYWFSVFELTDLTFNIMLEEYTHTYEAPFRFVYFKEGAMLFVLRWFSTQSIPLGLSEDLSQLEDEHETEVGLITVTYRLC